MSEEQVASIICKSADEFIADSYASLIVDHMSKYYHTTDVEEKLKLANHIHEYIIDVKNNLERHLVKEGREMKDERSTLLS